MIGFFHRIACTILGHRYGPWSEPALIGFTTAPYPATDELERYRTCGRCGKSETAFAGFVFDDREQRISTRMKNE